MTDPADKSPHLESIPDFEQALTELEELVQRLESGELALDQSLEEFRKGVELTRRCQLALDRAEQTVEQLLELDDETTAEPFEPNT